MPRITEEARENMLIRAAEEVLMHGGDLGKASDGRGLLEVMEDYGMDDLYHYWHGNFVTFGIL